MKNMIHLIFFNTIAYLTFAQINLVPNGSLEDSLSCPNGDWYDLLKSKYWFSPTINTSTPDYYYSGCGHGIGGAGYQLPLTGNAYGGLVLWQPNIYREYAEIGLIQPMIKDNKYCIEFYISLANESKYAINRISGFFSPDSLLCDTCLSLFFIADIQNDSDNIILDTMNWLQIYATYKADGGERFFTIGNFFPDSETNKILLSSGTYSMAYYYFDDVSIYEIPSLPPSLAGPDTIVCDSNTNGIVIGKPAITGYMYRWYPPYGLSDTTAAQPVAKPDSTTTYYLTVTDTTPKPYPCKPTITDTVTVTVKNCEGIDELRIKDLGLRIYPNPNNGTFIINYIFEDGGELVIYDVAGKEIEQYRLPAWQKEISITENDLNNGVYFYAVKNKEEVAVRRGKLVIIK